MVRQKAEAGGFQSRGGTFMNEWGFAAEVKSWWDSEFGRHPEWGLDRCEVERQTEGSLKRSDLVVWAGGRVLLSGELRLPDHPQSSPWDPRNLSGAIEKALTHGVRWAFTSDATAFLLVDVQRTGPPQTRVVHRVELITFEDRERLDEGAFLRLCRAEWIRALEEVAPIVLGLSAPRGMSPDEVFIGALRALLRAPVAAIREEMDRRRTSDAAFEQRLVGWMVDEQGWTHVPERWDEEVNRVTRLTAYVFTTRLVFYEALRRSQPTLSRLQLPDEVGAGVARGIVRAYFEEARERSGDYETLFEWDQEAEYALLSDEAVPGWRRVLEHLAVFDLANVSYDVIGRLFERLIDPMERYRWGQHYTNPDVCDLMLSFAIPDGEGTVMDPSAGGGTFLVRAYARKRLFKPTVSHQVLLSEIYGIDVSPFAASLSTVNLAARELSFADNYPQVAAASFFDVFPERQFMALPSPRRLGLGAETTRPVSMGDLRAVVTNPPYVRVQELGPDRRREVDELLRRPAKRVPMPQRVRRAANYHLYFWLHAAQFLADSGKLVFITAGEWMDSDYGVALQKWLLDHFAIECCVESIAEPWFSEARVGTVITVARMCPDEDERAENPVRFALLRRPLRELYGRPSTEAEHYEGVDRLRDRLLALTGEAGESDDLDWSVVRQGDLLALGTEGIPEGDAA
jgi:hypothetical protein